MKRIKGGIKLKQLIRNNQKSQSKLRLIILPVFAMVLIIANLLAINLNISDVATAIIYFS
jgi:hypothetical protein